MLISRRERGRKGLGILGCLRLGGLCGQHMGSGPRKGAHEPHRIRPGLITQATQCGSSPRLPGCTDGAPDDATCTPTLPFAVPSAGAPFSLRGLGAQLF